MIFSVNEAFVDPSATSFDLLKESSGNNELEVKLASYMFLNTQSLERLSTSACIEAYAQVYQVAHGNLLLVAPNNRGNFTQDPAAEYEDVIPPGYYGDRRFEAFRWVCGDRASDCKLHISTLQREAATWQPFGYPVEYCLSERIEQHCHLEYSAHILLIVGFMGILKFATMLYVTIGIHDTPLLTIGDAVASFLTIPDGNTKHLCLLDKSLKGYKAGTIGRMRGQARCGLDGAARPPIAFHYRRKYRFSAASIPRLLIFGTTFAGALTMNILFFVGAFRNSNLSFRQAWNSGFGKPSPGSILDWHSGTHSDSKTWARQSTMDLMQAIIVSNIPQIILSFLYLNYNGLMTVMSLAREWARFSVRRNGLRVSTTRKGAQRSTYFLQLPYRFGLPLLVLTGLLHWLLSQSIFLTYLQPVELVSPFLDPDYAAAHPDDIRYPYDYQTPEISQGFSTIASFVTMIVLTILLLWITVVGFMRLPSSMPVVSSYSAAIAAACHTTPEELGQDTAEAEIMWGETSDVGSGIGHCAFSMHEVREPQEGRLYA